MTEYDVFDRLYAFRRQHGFATWEQTVERLLRDEDMEREADSAARELSAEEATA